MPILVAIPFCRKDAHLALLNLELVAKLDGTVPFDCLLTHDGSAGDDFLAIQDKASKLFQTVHVLEYAPWRGEQVWPTLANYAWQQTARHIEATFAGKYPGWLWWEADATPLKAKWLTTLDDAYRKGKQPFAGFKVELRGESYMNGVGVWPVNVSWHLPNSGALYVRSAPFDRVAGRESLRKFCTLNGLIEHIVKSHGGGPGVTFDALSWQEWSNHHPDAVLLHGINQGCVVEMLLGRDVPALKSVIALHRDGAIGDVIIASAVAKKLHEQGYAVSLRANPVCLEALRGCSYLNATTVQVPNEIELDGAYESSAELQNKPKVQLFLETANRQLEKANLRIADTHNSTPVLVCPEEHRHHTAPLFTGHRRPWIVFCPRSNSFANRSVPAKTWLKVAEQLPGTCFWSGTDPSPGRPLVDLCCKTIPHLMGCLAHADLVCSVDTGPLHIAAGLGRPIVAIIQATAPRLVLSSQRDWIEAGADLSCLNCQKRTCPIDATRPPCAAISDRKIVEAIKHKLRQFDEGGISAIIPVLRPDERRLRRCLRQIRSQVSEVVVGLDGNAVFPPELSKNITQVNNPSQTRQGFGKTCTRAARTATGKYLLFLNDDCYLNDGAVKAMLAAMDEHTAVVGCQLRYPDGTIQHGGGARRAGDIGWGHLDHNKKTATLTQRTELEFVTFAAALVRRSVFFDLLGFDERYDCYCEDSDFCLRARQAGWKVVYEPAATGIHEESKTSKPIKNQLAKESTVTFERLWKWYFDLNPENGLGRFK